MRSPLNRLTPHLTKTLTMHFGSGRAGDIPRAQAIVSLFSSPTAPRSGCCHSTSQSQSGCEGFICLGSQTLLGTPGRFGRHIRGMMAR
jgi:hypothetical protein